MCCAVLCCDVALVRLQVDDLFGVARKKVDPRALAMKYAPFLHPLEP